MKTKSAWAAFIAASCAVFALPLVLRGETATPAVVHVRLWKTDLHDLTRLRVSLKPGVGKHAAAHDLGSGGPGYLFNNYADAPSGHGTLEVYTQMGKPPLLSVPVDLAPGAFLTVLLSEPEKADQPPRLEIIEDKRAARRAQLTVRTFVGNLKDMRIKVGESLSAQLVAGDSFLQIRGLKANVYSVHTSGAGADDKPFDWTNEVDLRQHPYQTLLVYPDPYGRVRPRLIVDGENQADSPDSGDGQR